MGWLGVVVGGGGLRVGDHGYRSPRLMEMKMGGRRRRRKCVLGPYRHCLRAYIGPLVDLEEGDSYKTKREGGRHEQGFE